ncbi:unnamed protein product [Hermetia illucens]|uniref:Thrombospondin-like N-terminal domain-containing protein n=1 Tax=Hermetia illucens TaxID=343691 RepID=A0A7R8V736_HERIL|nr:uncharacterized protein LOC119659291 [Hermetia illucens]CAD7093307.1 unnamed protein product [Hermetia illucens]
MSSSWLINLITVLYWSSLTSGTGARCEFEGVQELIKTSPVILKALGAKIFADIDIRPSEQKIEENGVNSANNTTTILSSLLSQTTSTLITLTPTTIYKGASLLKVVPTVDGGEYYHYDGQINATLDPLLLCSEAKDNNILNVLPAELIVFGKLDGDQSDILRISANGLHKWTPLFENHIWKYLGWDDWSDFTACSVMCGKGVQQRFRRCLLDNHNADTSEMESRVEYYHPSPSTLRINGADQNNKHNPKKYGVGSRLKKRRKKKGKVLSTQSCEGYNIEQRNCNVFECSDDIMDLLKFYKKPSSDDGTSSQMKSTMTTQQSPLNSTVFAASQATSTETIFRSWESFLNFTIMITLRGKIKSQATIFSLRNATHNLYLEQSPEGLKLFQERNDVTEMLPIKLDLYDNRWHQIAISVHNGDFITIYVDCLWTDSFIVSKGLFALPDAADVVVGGRSFCGDLQQLLIIPGNHEKSQCSSLRTSINEVKRYIIDTFIEDDIN